MEAKVFTSGNLGNDAKVINFENGNAVITFSIATNSYYTNSDGELESDESETDRINKRQCEHHHYLSAQECAENFVRFTCQRENSFALPGGHQCAEITDNRVPVT